jgi:hypothetical protein
LLFPYFHRLLYSRKETPFSVISRGSFWFIFPSHLAAQKKRDTFASAYRGVWHTLSTEWKKHTLNA